jgi:hypothetical protein
VVRDWFITPGIDEQKVLDDVHEQAKEEVVGVHWHSKGVQCDENCRLYVPGRESFDQLLLP